MFFFFHRFITIKKEIICYLLFAWQSFEARFWQRLSYRLHRKQSIPAFEVLSIDINRAKAISKDNVYTEAKALLKSGSRYWFDDEDIAELYKESEDFQVQTAEMELLLRCFEKPTEDNLHSSYMTTTEIITYLGYYTHHPLSLKNMGEALKRAGFEKVSRKRGGNSPVYVYKIRKILPCPLLDSYSRVCSIDYQ